MIHPWFQHSGKRKPYFFAFVGQNGSGKTTLAKKFLALNSRNLIFPSNPIDGKRSWGDFPVLEPQYVAELNPVKNKQERVLRLPQARYLQNGSFFVNTSNLRDHKSGLQLIHSLFNEGTKAYFGAGGLVIDDFKNYCIGKGTVPHEIKQMGINYRHFMTDVFLAFHGMQDVNGDLFTHGLRFWLFQTNQPPSDSALEKCFSPQELIETIEAINWINNNMPQYEGHYCEPYDPASPEINKWTRENLRPKI